MRLEPLPERVFHASLPTTEGEGDVKVICWAQLEPKKEIASLGAATLFLLMWRSVKYERVYLRAYVSINAARHDIRQYIDGHNTDRGHSNLDGKTPEQVWFSGLPSLTEAA